MGHWVDEDGNLTNGRYHGETLEDVAGEDPSYLEWMLDEANLDSDERKQVESALEN